MLVILSSLERYAVTSIHKCGKREKLVTTFARVKVKAVLPASLTPMTGKALRKGR
jgi:hypothetical protein